MGGTGVGEKVGVGVVVYFGERWGSDLHEDECTTVMTTGL